MFLWVILIIAVIYYLGRENGHFSSHHNNHNQRPNNSGHPGKRDRFSSKKQKMNYNQEAVVYDIEDGQALKTARERYAAGEIDKEEFEEIKRNLK